MERGESMTTKVFHGCYAAVLLPRDTHGSPDEAALVRQLEFLLARGICNFAFNGATGEYPQIRPDELKKNLQIAKATLPIDAGILCGIGAASLRETLLLAAIAGQVGVTGFLVPAPLFFPYAQDDLAVFVEAVSAELSQPLLLYNLPRFTTGFETLTAVHLIKANVVGIKDSSGSLETLRALTDAEPGAARIIGNDSVLAEALTEGICDGAVSGVACVLPELILPLFANRPGTAAFESIAEKLQQFISKIDVLPTPWGLKAVAEARDIANAVYPLPLSDRRERQICELQGWFRDWIPGITERESAIRA
jgi:4-hydroxy-tetrahydrodipicolinate synthase